MSDLKNMAKMIAETSSKDATSAYDTTATVVRLDGGVAYVHIDGGVTETPADMTISCQAGDSVKIRVAGGKAWITGNVTAPPTDDREAKVAQLVANSAINTASNAQDVADSALLEAQGRKVVSSTTKYKLSSYGTIRPTTGVWYDEPQEQTEDRPYLWTKNVVTYADGTAAEFYGVSKMGDKGEKGLQGDPGEQGIQGLTGADGKTSYLHIAYATSADGKSGFSVSDSTNKTYMGQYTDFTSTDSTDPTKYAWTKIKGDTGAKGEQGVQGEQGVKGDPGDTGADGEDTSNLVKNGLGEYLDNTYFTNHTYTRGDVPADSGAWGYFTSNDWTFGTQLIDFDASLTYNISFYARLHEETASATGYFSINPRDVDDKLIVSMCVPWYNKNEFYLAEDLKKGDTVVKFKDLTGWNTSTTATYQRSLLFYGYTDSTGYTYPDFTYSQNYYNGVYADNSSVDLTNNTITLKTAWTGKEFSAGTAVSQTSNSSSYCYYGLAGALKVTDWKRYTGTMKADDTTNGMRLKYAKSFRVGLLANDNIDWCGIRIEKVSQATSDAKSTADTAQSTADSAKTAADTAQGTANTANSNAQSAQQSANQANSAVSNLETTLTKEIQETTEGWQAVFKRVGMYDADADNPSNPEDPESSTSTKVSISEDGLIVEGNSGTDSIKTTVKNGLYGTNKNGDDIFHLDQQGVHTGRAYLDNGYECVGLKMVPITVDGVNYLIYIKSGGTA